MDRWIDRFVFLPQFRKGLDVKKIIKVRVIGVLRGVRGCLGGGVPEITVCKGSADPDTLVIIMDLFKISRDFSYETFFFHWPQRDDIMKKMGKKVKREKNGNKRKKVMMVFRIPRWLV